MRRCRLARQQAGRLKMPLAATVFNWSVWVFIAALLGAQMFGFFWNTTVSYRTLRIGRSPLRSMTNLEGFNDEPYADRAIVCMVIGGAIQPMQLSTVADSDAYSKDIGSPERIVDGFRAAQRDSPLARLSDSVVQYFKHTCAQINTTLRAIQDGCDALGFRTNRHALRIIAGVYGNRTREASLALPIVIIPFWDNAYHAYYAIPGQDGMACVFRLNGIYQSNDAAYGDLVSVTRTSRSRNTVKWLGKPEGEWRNGWYEASDGTRWFSNMMASSSTNAYDIDVRHYDTLANQELDCRNEAAATTACRPSVITDRWGNQFALTTEITQQNQVFISNGERFGIFLFDAMAKSSVTIKYTLESVISNVSIVVILIHWLLALAVMLRSYRLGLSERPTIGIASVSSYRTFNALVVLVLPHLKMTAATFWSAGCHFEGQQSALADAWLVMYPGIIEFVFTYYSFLNSVAKITHRRMSDALFGPTVVFMCLLHYLRLSIADSDWFGFDGRLPTLVLSDEFAGLSLYDFFLPDVVLRLGGNATKLYYTKLAVLVLNLVPLLLSEKMNENGHKHRRYAPCQIEASLALRHANIGGLGRSEVYTTRTVGIEPRGTDSAPSWSLVRLLAMRQVQPIKLPLDGDRSASGHVVIGYELCRLGYVVYGGKYLISIEDWCIVMSLKPFRELEKLWDHRISVFKVQRDNGAYRASVQPSLYRIDDPQLRASPFYDAVVCAFR